MSLILAFGVAGGLLCAGGKADERARNLGLTFLLFGTLFADRLLSRAASSVEGLPSAGLSFLATVHLYAFLPTAQWLFAWSFPAVQSGLVPAWLTRQMPGVTMVAGVVLAFGTLVLGAADPSPLAIQRLASWLSPVDKDGWFWQVCSILILPSLLLLVAKLRVAKADQRRRLGWVVAGLVVGSTPMILHVLLATTVAPYAEFFDVPRRSLALGIALTAFSLVIPATTAYAVVVDQALEVRFVVRRAVQYALTRYAVLALMVGILGGLAAVGYGNRTRPVGEILSESPATALALALAAGLLLRRRALFDAIDRRFFREQYDARRILVALVDGCQKATTSRDILRLIAAEVDRALHLERVSLLVRESDRNHLWDPEGRVRDLDLDGALGSLIERSPAPLDVDLSSDGSLLGRLPDQDREWLADAHARLVVPLGGADGRLLGVLTLGDKLSELPFTHEDRQLLTAVAASAAVALEQRLRRESSDPDRPSPATSDLARQCRNCGRVQDRRSAACHACSGALHEALLPAVLAGKFEIERQIGAGGMGVVYLARDLALGRLVALKVLPRVGPEATARLRREARAMATLQHPHLAVIHSMESWRGVPVLVIEFLSGGTVADRLRAGERPIDEVVSLGLLIADVLHHVHRAGYLHRDIKPSNIGYTGEGVVKLLDFGLVRLTTRLSEFSTVAETTATASAGAMTAAATAGAETGPIQTPANRLVGTAAYLSPEAVTLGYPSVGLDLWALAVTVYEALTRRNPFAAPTVGETLRLIAQASPPDPRDIRLDCSQPLASFLLSALAADRRRRPESALQFKERLLDAAHGR